MPSPSQDIAELPHDNVQPNLISCAVITWVIAAVFVGLRFYARRIVINAWGISDWLILASLVFSAATTAGALEEVGRGLGKHIWDVDPDQIPGMLRAMWYCILFYALTQFTAKLSILFLFMSIFTFDWIRWAIKICLAVVVVTNIFIIISLFTACIPLQAYWDMTVVPTYCQSQGIYWASTGVHIGTDILIYLLPIPVVCTLRLPKRQKMAVVGVFAVGFFACLASLLRLVFLIQAEVNPSTDSTYGGSLGYWTSIEYNSSIFVACLMTLKPLAAVWFPKHFNDSYQQWSSGRDAPPTIGRQQSEPSSSRKYSHGRSSADYSGTLDELDAESVGPEMSGEGPDAMVLTDLESQKSHSQP